MGQAKYKTVYKESVAEQIIDKSRFICHVCPVETKEEADKFIAKIRSQHKDANHNVPAMVIGEKFQIQWASDDGEPQGTSGAPMVQMIVKEGITNVVVVVTRYFGGIKLGTGGLVRAYTSSAKLGLNAGGLCEIKDMCVLEVKVDYTYLNKIQNLEGGIFKIGEIIYEDKVIIKLNCEPEELQELKNLLNNMTGGQAEIKNENIIEVKVIV